jgi:hypothetical protein
VVPQAIHHRGRDEYRTSLRQFRADRLLAVQAHAITELKAQVAEAQWHLQMQVDVTANAVEQSRSWEAHHAALRQHADELERNYEVLRQDADELRRHARALEALVDGRRLRNLLLRVLRLGRRAVQRAAGESG